jgi:hypothetical protein
MDHTQVIGNARNKETRSDLRGQKRPQAGTGETDHDGHGVACGLNPTIHYGLSIGRGRCRHAGDHPPVAAAASRAEPLRAAASRAEPLRASAAGNHVAPQ